MKLLLQVRLRGIAHRRGARPLRHEALERREMFSISPGGDFDALLTHGGACGCPICSGFGDIAAEIAGQGDYLLAPPIDEPVGSSIATYPLSALPQLSSLPESPYTLHLDFDGHFEPIWGGYSNATTPVFDRDGDATTFSQLEIDTIVEVWTRVSEDFAPFNINVTTVDPGDFSPRRALKVAIGGGWSDWFGEAAGGVAYVNSFTNSLANTVYVFSNALGNGYAKYVADAASHEAGHGFGLWHQSSYNGDQKTAEYNSGSGDWAPLMGVSYYASLSTWYDGRNNYGSYQDDMDRIARSYNGFGYRPDDHGMTPQAATSLSVSNDAINASGVIGRNDDRDYFSFTTGGGQVTLEASVIDVGANLDAVLELRDADNALIVRANPSDSQSATITTTLTSGTYYAVVQSTGVYGRVGQYTLSGSVPGPSDPTPPPPEDPQEPQEPHETFARSTIGLYSGAKGSFFLRNENSAGPANDMFNFGPVDANWVPLSGDWNGDGQTTVGLYNPAAGTFFLRNSNSAGAAQYVFQFGPGGLGWQPLVGDWNGDGTDTVGLYNPDNGNFFLRNAHAAGGADAAFQFGPGGDAWLPITGDWNGNGQATIGLYRQTDGAYFLRNANSNGAANESFHFGPGGANWTPISGDWNADGQMTIGLYSGSAFYLRNAHAGGAADVTFHYGPVDAGFRPLVGAWSGVQSAPLSTTSVQSAVDGLKIAAQAVAFQASTFDPPAEIAATASEGSRNGPVRSATEDAAVHPQVAQTDQQPGQWSDNELNAGRDVPLEAQPLRLARGAAASPASAPLQQSTEASVDHLFAQLDWIDALIDEAKAS